MVYKEQETEAFIDGDMQTLRRMLPPNGRFYLAKVDGEFIGIGGLKQLDKTTGEVKRMFVRNQEGMSELYPLCIPQL